MIRDAIYIYVILNEVKHLAEDSVKHAANMQRVCVEMFACVQHDGAFSMLCNIKH
jgi:hypothetical protein